MSQKTKKYKLSDSDNSNFSGPFIDDNFTQALLLANSDLTFIISKQGFFLDLYCANPEILFVDYEKIVGNSIEALLPPDVAAITLQKLILVFETGRKETYIYLLGGQTYRSTITKIDDDRAIALINNIESEIVLRHDLNVTRRNYSQLIEMMPLGVMISKMVLDNNCVCNDFEVISVNKEYYTIVGNAEIVGKRLSKLMSEIEMNWFLDCLNSANSKKSVVRENYDPWLDKWIFSTAYPTENNEFVIIITDLGKTAEQRYLIRKSEERYSFALKNSKTFVWEWNVDNQWSYFSESITSILGFTKAELPRSNEKVLAFCHPSDRHYLYEIWERISRRSLDDFSIQVRFINKDEKYIWLEVQGKVAAYTDSDTPKRIIGSCTDISFIKENQAALVESEALFKSIFTNSPIGICIIDFGGYLLNANEAALQILGGIASSMQNTVSIFETELIPLDYRRDLKLYKPVDFTIWVNTEDLKMLGFQIINKRKVYLRFRFTPLYLNEKDHLKNRILLQVTDHTYEKEHEREIIISQKYHENAMEIAKLAFWSYFFDDHKFNTSNEFLRIFEIDNTLDLSLPDVLAKIANPDDKAKLEYSIKNMNTSDLNHSDEFELAINVASGIRHIFVKTTIIYQTQGEIIGLFGVIQDVSDRKKLEIELRNAKEKAEESDKLKTAFLANMSHEIRTPLNSIVGFSGLLANDMFELEQKQEFVKRIEFNSNQLLNLISDIIDFARLESGTMSIQRDEVYVKELFNSIVEANKINCPANVDFIGDFSKIPDTRIMITDSVKLIQIITNLLSNAFKFTEQGSVILCAFPDGKWLKIVVADTGIGINEDEVTLIFERFYQSNHLKRGTGLGLAISKSLVLSLGGKIEVSSKLNQGTSFTVTLPFEL